MANLLKPLPPQARSVRASVGVPVVEIVSRHAIPAGELCRYRLTDLGSSHLALRQALPIETMESDAAVIASILGSSIFGFGTTLDVALLDLRAYLEERFTQLQGAVGVDEKPSEKDYIDWLILQKGVAMAGDAIAPGGAAPTPTAETPDDAPLCPVAEHSLSWAVQDEIHRIPILKPPPAGEEKLQTGQVLWFNDKKGYGFITGNGGLDAFVHRVALEMDGYKTLHEGQEVTYEVETTEKGPRAVRVRIVGVFPPPPPPNFITRWKQRGCGIRLRGRLWRPEASRGGAFSRNTRRRGRCTPSPRSAPIHG